MSLEALATKSHSASVIIKMVILLAYRNTEFCIYLYFAITIHSPKSCDLQNTWYVEHVNLNVAEMPKYV